jgi:hypothetical protein
MAKKIDVYKLALENTTPQQQIFAEQFALCLNGTKAALAAEYSEKTARQQASRLLTNVYIKTLIQHKLVGAGADPEEIAARWDRIARVDLADFYTREQVEYRPRIQKPLSEIVDEYRREIEFEQEVALRTEALITDRKKREKYRKEQQQQHEARERKLLRLEIEWEQNPTATRLVSGPAVLRDELRLDLAKAESLGLLDLVKTVTTGRGGTSFSLRDPDAALDNLAKWRGMLVSKLDITSGGEPIEQPPLLGVLTLEQKKELLAAKRKAAAQVGEGQADA